MDSLVRLEKWAQDIICDPLSKEVLHSKDGSYVSSYGRVWPIKNNVADFRVYKEYVSEALGIWKDGQDHYEEWSEEIPDSFEVYQKETEGVADVYKAIPIIGRTLDVGGHQGRLRAFMEEGQEYLSVDPYANVFQHIDKQNGLTKAYPFILKGTNFIQALAEHLPVKTVSFDTVHMRSCLDHFYNPELSLLEAYRVLRPEGQLVIGLYVEGGKKGPTLWDHWKERIKDTLGAIGIKRYQDHHVWHPSYDSLLKLITNSGFKIEKTHWQASHPKVCYIKAVKA